MRIAICGANGFIGTQLSQALVSSGHEVVRIGREHFKNPQSLSRCLEGCDVVVNLCGAPILKKWDEIYKHELYVSRIETTKKLLKEIANLEQKPRQFISVSAVGIYKEDKVHEDNSTQFGTSYLALLAKEWEQQAGRAEQLGLKTTIFRLGVVLGRDGGVMEEFKLAFRIGLGAVPSDGKQPFSWVHMDDVLSVLQKAILTQNMSGIYNLVAPENVTMKTFMQTFGKMIGKPVWLNVPEAILKMRYGEGAQSLLKGAFVIPRKLEDEGYVFKYNNLNTALQSLLTN